MPNHWFSSSGSGSSAKRCNSISNDLIEHQSMNIDDSYVLTGQLLAESDKPVACLLELQCYSVYILSVKDNKFWKFEEQPSRFQA